ncbi:MAG TPA: glycosyltransferase family 4 protein [Mycobacteriales bacterium]|nr:glycosyltransferase family 4 protein [Mycobacteriales bacterium]
MTAALAIFVPVVGQASEIFLRRHVEGLAPGRTVVIARRAAAEETATWGTSTPVLWLDPLLDEWGGVREREAVRQFLVGHDVRAALLEYLDIWLPFLPILRERHAVTVVHGHGYDLSARLRHEEWRRAYRAYNEVDVVVVPSAHSASRLFAIGLSRERLRVVPYGVESLPALPDRRPGPALRVLMVGRLVAKKNPLATLRACSVAADAGAQIDLSVVGDGPLREEMASAARRASFPMTMRGPLPNAEVLAAMGAADIFCQHSVVDPQTGDEEGLPVAILEAMANGLPVVSTRHAGIPEAVVDGVTGCLVEEGDVEAMAEGIVRLAADVVLRKRMADAARDRVAERFGLEQELHSLRQLLRVSTVG